MYTIPISHPSLTDTVKNTQCGDGSHFTAYGRPKRVGCLSKRIDANSVCTYPNKCLLVDEQNSRTALVHADGLWHGEVKPNCVFQPQSKETLEQVRQRWEGYQRVCDVDVNAQKDCAASRTRSKTHRDKKVLAKFPPEHIAKISVCIICLL